MQVLRGFEPTEPSKLSSLAAPIDGAAIRSGMVIVKATGAVNGANTTGAFRKSLTTDAPGATNEGTAYYLALHDQDSHDVQSSGKLVGLDCSDSYEVQTGYFDKTKTYTLNAPLTVLDGGLVTLATVAGHNVIGYVTATGSGTGGSLPYFGKTPSTGSTVADSEVLQFKTARNGQLKLSVGSGSGA